MATKRRDNQHSLGTVEHTARGFEVVHFTDLYGEECTLQVSSLAEPAAVWLGCQNNAKPHHVTQEPNSPRMHLSRAQVKGLVRQLKNWLCTGSFAEPES